MDGTYSVATQWSPATVVQMAHGGWPGPFRKKYALTGWQDRDADHPQAAWGIFSQKVLLGRRNVCGAGKAQAFFACDRKKFSGFFTLGGGMDG